MLTAVFIAFPLVMNAQTENPRGIYKMITLTGKMGEIKAPYEQYKICTDSVTLMVTEQGSHFTIINNDHQVFNYTGEQPKSEDDKSTLVYDSDEKQFKEKWWSTYEHHIHFPHNDWCIEKYESGHYTELSKYFFDAITGKSEVDNHNPLTGTWRIIGMMDELRNVKKELRNLFEQCPTSKYVDCFIVYAPKYSTMIAANKGLVDKIEFNGKKSYKIGNKNSLVKWLSKDVVAIEEKVDYRTDWLIIERVTDGTIPLAKIAGKLLLK